jgi:hypothetical protein
MREADVEVILERAKEKYPVAKPRIISEDKVFLAVYLLLR